MEGLKTCKNKRCSQQVYEYTEVKQRAEPREARDPQHCPTDGEGSILLSETLRRWEQLGVLCVLATHQGYLPAGGRSESPWMAPQVLSFPSPLPRLGVRRDRGSWGQGHPPTPIPVLRLLAAPGSPCLL